jgi:uncharacterized repeat protein (TIGR03803 family)
MRWRGTSDSTTTGKGGMILVLMAGTLLALCLWTFEAKGDVVVTTLHSFQGSIDGSNCVTGLVQGSDGSLYGTTIGGGAYNYGTVFKISRDGDFTNLHSFAGDFDGANPYAGLVQYSDGNFYGTTFNAGTNDCGTVFKIAADGTFVSLHSFIPYSDGTCSYGAMAQGNDGNLYGTTYHGGSWGTLFRVDPNGLLSTFYWFNGFGDGGYPTVGLTKGSDGNFYGTQQWHRIQMHAGWRR